LTTEILIHGDTKTDDAILLCTGLMDVEEEREDEEEEGSGRSHNGWGWASRLRILYFISRVGGLSHASLLLLLLLSLDHTQCNDKVQRSILAGLRMANIPESG